MEEQTQLPYPYEFSELTTEEKELLNKTFDSYPTEHVHVGPKGYLVYKPFKRGAANIYNMPLRPTDIFVASYQRSGTTWTQELVWLLATNFDYEKAAQIPLTHRYPFLELFMYFEEGGNEDLINFIVSKNEDVNPEMLRKMLEIMSKQATSILADTPSPRFIKTHLPMSLLPPKVLDTAKVVYVARDPRDVAVSSYFHAKFFKMACLTGEIKDMWNMFHKNAFTLTPYFEQVKEAWEQRNHPNMLFLFYEELSKDLPAAIRRVSQFLGKEVTPEQMDRLDDHLSIENFRKNQSVNWEDFREYGLLDSKETFVRKGKTGGWRDYFDEEMTQQAEQWISDNLRDTDLRFPSMSN